MEKPLAIYNFGMIYFEIFHNLGDVGLRGSPCGPISLDHNEYILSDKGLIREQSEAKSLDVHFLSLPIPVTVYS